MHDSKTYILVKNLKFVLCSNDIHNEIDLIDLNNKSVLPDEQ